MTACDSLDLSSYRSGAWDALSFVMNTINSFEEKTIPKKVIYHAVADMNPTDIMLSNGRFQKGPHATN